MTSKIPVRRARTVGTENENARPSQAVVRAKPVQHLGAAASSSKVTTASTDATAPRVALGEKKTDSDATANGKRKRAALQEVPVLKNRGGKGKDKEVRTTVTMPKETTTREPLRVLPPIEEGALPSRPPVFIAPPATRVSDAAHHRRSSSGRSLIPVLQREKPAEEDDDAHVSKRQRTSSVGPEDENEIATELGAYTDDEEEPEADPDGDLWDDLDAADFDDPLMVSEYVADIQLYLKEAELVTMPSPTYMDSQPKLSWEMRGLLNEWLMQVHVRFHLTSETLFLCTNLIDRFLSTRIVSHKKLQLVGMACMFIAAKYEETVAPAVLNFVHVSDGAYEAAEMLQAEQHILHALEWNLSYPSPINYLRRISKVDDYDPQSRTVAKYLAEISCVEWRLIATPPSLVAAAAMWLARIALGEETWTPNLAHYSTYAESAVLPAANHMLDYILQPIVHESFYKKYAGKKNMKVSVYMRQWALARWAEGTRVDLAAKLQDVKNEIRAQKTVRIAQQMLRKARADAAAGTVVVDEDDTW